MIVLKQKKGSFHPMNILFLLFMSFTTLAIHAQEGTEQPVPRFEKLAIGEKGKHVYMPKGDTAIVIEAAYSQDSSVFYTAEVPVGDFMFFLIAVEFPEKQEMDAVQKEGLLISYLDYLQEAFGIMGAAGYGKGHTLDAVPSMIGVFDYWEDADLYSWAVKGWINEKYLVVFMVYGPKEYPYINAQQMFFEGLRIE
jgi:hypothetical protein